MSYDTPTAPTLFDLLARGWTLPGPVEAAVFNAEGTTVAFAGPGELALVPVADPDDPATRIRMAADTGRQTISPRKTPVRPAIRVAGTCGPVVPWGGKSFLTGSAKGGLISVTPRGQAVPLALALDGTPAAMARDPRSAAVALAVGAALVVLPDDLDTAPRRATAPGVVSALAWLGGDRLAVGFSGGIALWDGTWGARIALQGTPTSLTPSPDGALLAVGFADPGIAVLRLGDLAVDLVPDYPTPTRALVWSVPGAALVSAGAFRTVAWAATAQGRGGPIEAGRTGLVIVDRVAAAPDRPLVAAGYASGLVSLTKLGTREEMMLRGNGGAVTALTWSPGGAQLALGDATGACALVSFPPNMFK